MSHSIAIPSACPAGSRRLGGWAGILADYWTLTKPEVNFLIVVSTLAGFCLGARGLWKWGLLVHTLFGTLLVASGTATLNQYLERDLDAQMRRTAGRPLPARRLAARQALWFGILLSTVGGFYLALAVNVLASLLALSTLAAYLLLYTPLKRMTPLCTLVGALPGAMPPLIGWAAARGTLDRDAWVLYAILFLWQFPHFLAIAWMYREDYARAGFRMLPRTDTVGRFTSGEILALTAVLLPVSLLPTFLGQTGVIYFSGALVAGLAFLAYGFRLAISRSNAPARGVLLASVVYLPIVFGLMILDKIPTY